MLGKRGRRWANIETALGEFPVFAGINSDTIAAICFCYLGMNEWTNERTIEWMNKWMNEWMNEWMNG